MNLLRNDTFLGWCALALTSVIIAGTGVMMDHDLTVLFGVGLFLFCLFGFSLALDDTWRSE